MITFLLPFFCSLILKLPAKNIGAAEGSVKKKNINILCFANTSTYSLLKNASLLGNTDFVSSSEQNTIKYILVYRPHFWYHEIVTQSECVLYLGQTKGKVIFGII